MQWTRERFTAFTDLEPRTRSDYQRVFDYLQPIADTPLASFDTPLVVRIRDKAAASKGRKFANDVKARFSGLFGWGAERGVSANFAAGIKDICRKKGAPEANRPWSDEEREAVLDVVPAHMKPALSVMMFTGLGPKDALKLPRKFYKDGESRPDARRPGNRCSGPSRQSWREFWPLRRITTRRPCARIRMGVPGPKADFGRPGALYE